LFSRPVSLQQIVDQRPPSPASALASLPLENFDLDSEPPTVSLAVRHDKSRKGKVQPINRSGAERGYAIGSER
jgi:hypothetical protein